MESDRAIDVRRPSFDLREHLEAGSHGYSILLPLLICSLVFQLAAPDEGWARGVTIAIQGAVLILALRLSGVHRWARHAVTLVVVVALLATTGVLIGSGELGHVAGRGVALMVVALAPVAIAYGVVREGLRVGRVTVRMMFGVLCIYLLLGMLFAFAYGTVAALAEAPFFAGGESETQANFLYFSIVTQTTTGYGDLTAATGLGRSLAASEALLGQIYLVTVVALIVGNLGRSRRRATP